MLIFGESFMIQNKKAIILLIVMAVSAFFVVFFGGRLHELSISETCNREIVLSKDVVFNQSETTELYGDSVILPAGTTGVIADSIDYSGDTKGYDLINVHLARVDEQSYDVAISFDQVTDTKMNEDRTLIFDISYIESAETILSEYKNSREKYYTRIRNARLCGAVVGLSFSVLLFAVFYGLFRKQIKNEKSTTILLKVIVVLDVIFVIAVLFEMSMIFRL